MEAPKKGRLLTFKNKTFKMWRKRRQRPALDKKSGVKETPNLQMPPLSTSEESEMSNCETTVDLPKPQDDQSIGTSIKEQSSTTSDITCVDITSVYMTSADSEKRLKDMSSEGQKQLVVCLQPNDVLGNDYRRLADKLGYRNDYIKYLGSTDEPVKTLIKEKGDMKILELIPLLEDMGRNDVVEELQKSLKATSTPKQIEERVRRRENKLMTSTKPFKLPLL
ncbi:uncharacterized protein LOC110067920 isoform X1 [Orbicella faveolata]|uniref:uncharacterized protein LOC110067920 isoform X1 n=1 Tax=Orbicella faveolata TaxID=48498 RepID=UPI0009E2868D|nr:uncharacterized protein LOC110067920 isoform X1 [Orbicella faveolata]